ncbi:MAG TPA: MoaD/ThiS family protein [Chroococcales cyanobacterium]
MRVRIPSPLRSYTHNQSEVSGSGASVQAVLENLDRNFPGIRFRMIDEQDAIRPHIKLFVNSDSVVDLATPIDEQSTLHIICALSGG